MQMMLKCCDCGMVFAKDFPDMSEKAERYVEGNSWCPTCAVLQYADSLAMILQDRQQFPGELSALEKAFIGVVKLYHEWKGIGVSGSADEELNYESH